MHRMCSLRLTLAVLTVLIACLRVTAQCSTCVPEGACCSAPSFCCDGACHTQYECGGNTCCDGTQCCDSGATCCGGVCATSCCQPTEGIMCCGLMTGACARDGHQCCGQECIDLTSQTCCSFGGGTSSVVCANASPFCCDGGCSQFPCGQCTIFDGPSDRRATDTGICNAQFPTCCDGLCVDTQSDFFNCGACSDKCTLEVDAACCHGSCANFNTDQHHCGQCDHDCGSEACCEGACAATCMECGFSRKRVDGEDIDGNCNENYPTCCDNHCANTASDDLRNCGACGHVCDDGDCCRDGLCTSCDACIAGSDCHSELLPTCCDGACANTWNGDVYNCGGCGLSCFAPTPRATFPEGTQVGCCQGECIELSDAANCGACSSVCGDALTCCAFEEETPPSFRRGEHERRDLQHSCVSLFNDPANCGTCGNACLVGEECCNGECMSTALDCGSACTIIGYETYGCNDEVFHSCCGGSCANTFNNDAYNCGECGRSCFGGSEPSEKRASDEDEFIGCCRAECVDLREPTNCGECGATCVVAVETCCVFERTPVSERRVAPQHYAQCIDLSSDDSNCGTCGNQCPAGLACSGGACGASPPPVPPPCGGACLGAGEQCCDGVCRVLTSDESNCGACAAQCAPSESCCDGRCVSTSSSDGENCGACGRRCSAGRLCCSGACVDTLSSNANCGQCGQSCLAGARCCSGDCSDLQSDLINCGACGNRCPTGQVCRRGTCGAPPPPPQQSPPPQPPPPTPVALPEPPPTAGGTCSVDADCFVTGGNLCLTRACDLTTRRCYAYEQCPQRFIDPCTMQQCDATSGACVRSVDAVCNGCFAITNCTECLSRSAECAWIQCPLDSSINGDSFQLPDIVGNSGVIVQSGNVTFVNATVTVSNGTAQWNVSFSGNFTTPGGRFVCMPRSYYYLDSSSSSALSAEALNASAALRAHCPTALCFDGVAVLGAGGIVAIVAGFSLLPLVAVSGMLILAGIFFARCRRRDPGTWIEPEEFLNDFSADGITNSPLYVDANLVQDSQIYDINMPEWEE